MKYISAAKEYIHKTVKQPQLFQENVLLTSQYGLDIYIEPQYFKVHFCCQDILVHRTFNLLVSFISVYVFQTTGNTCHSASPVTTPKAP